MVVKLKAPLQALQSFLKASGRFPTVVIGEPFSPPDSMTAALLLTRYDVSSLTLNGTIERRTITVRIYHDALAEPREETEFLLDDAVAETVEDFLGDLDLGESIRNIEPIGITVRYGFQLIQQRMYRIVDIEVPMTVDDSATLVR